MSTLTDPQRVAAEADAAVLSLTAGVQPDAVEPLGSGDVYDKRPGLATAYMIGGGGPTSYATVLPDPLGGRGDVMILVDVYGWGEREHRVITGAVAHKIAAALRAAQ